MRLVWLASGLAAASIGAPAAAAEPVREPRDVRTHIMWYPAERLWTDALPVEACGPRLLEATGDARLAAPLRRATYERRGELIAELRPGPRRVPAVLTEARMCAAKAAGAVTTPALLTPAPQPWETFHLAFAACLKGTPAASQVGSMTLWIDTSCNW